MGSRDDTIVALTIHSGDRDDFLGSSGDFTIALRKSLRNITQINVADVVIPKTQFLINAGNDTLVGLYRSPATAPGVPFTIVLPHGDFGGGSPAVLAIGLEAAFDADPVLGLAGIAPGGWTIAYDATARRITFAAATVGPVAPWAIQFIFTPLTNVIGLANAAALTDAELLTFVSANPAAAAVATNRVPTIRRPMYYNITSTALTQDINTSYVKSVTKTFDIGAGDNVIDLAIARDMTNTVHPNAPSVIPFGVVAFSADDKVMVVAVTNMAAGGMIYDNLAPSGPAAWTLRGAIPLPGDLIFPALSLNTGVAISADGTTVAAGGANDNNNIGAVWVFHWNGAVWTQQAKLLPTGAIGSARLGTQIVLSADGNVLAASGARDDTLRGAVWVYTRTGAVWSFTQKIVVTGLAFAQFGTYLTMSSGGAVMAVGLTGNVSGGQRVFLYRGAAGVYALERTINSAEFCTTTSISSGFGFRVCLSGDGLVMAASTVFNITIGPATYVGGIFTYHYNIATGLWEGPQTLLDSVSRFSMSAGAALGATGARMFAFKNNPAVLLRYRAIPGAIGWELEKTITGVAGLTGTLLVPMYAAPSGNAATLNRAEFAGTEPFAVLEARVFNYTRTVTLPLDEYLIGRMLFAINAQTVPAITDAGAVAITATFDEKSERVTLAATSNLTTGQGEYVVFTVAPTTTFKVAIWTGVAAPAQVSTVLDLSINNNVLRTIVDRDSSSADYVHSDTKSEDTRRYRAGFTIEAGAPVDIQLRDERDRIVDLDGANWIMTLLVEIHD